MKFCKYSSLLELCFFFTWANIFKTNRRMEKKKKKYKNRKEEKKITDIQIRNGTL